MRASGHWIVVARQDARTRVPARSWRHRDTTTRARRSRSRRSPSTVRGSRAPVRATHQTARSERPCTPGPRLPSAHRSAPPSCDRPCRPDRTRVPCWSLRSSTRAATTSRSCLTLSRRRQACAGTTAHGESNTNPSLVGSARSPPARLASTNPRSPSASASKGLLIAARLRRARGAGVCRATARLHPRQL